MFSTSISSHNDNMFVEVCLGLMAFSVLGYLIPVLLESFVYKEQDFKKMYGASWAIVTGGSTGIGKAIVERLASQGINVVIVALDDAELKKTTEEMRAQYPTLEFRQVGADLSGTNGDYMKTIKEATQDIDVNLVFNNAGYILTGLFANLPVERHLHNLEVNMLSSVKITHHFVNDMLDKRMKGFVGFTSSSAGFLPSPMSVMYGSTKIFLTEFAASIAGELQPHGIDVLVVHPSPIASNFYDNAGKMSALTMFQKTARAPSAIADCLFTSAGRTVIRDQGYFTILAKLMLKVMDWNLLINIARYTVQTMGDYKAMKVPREAKPLASSQKK